MEALRVVINIIFILVCVALTVLVLMQEGKSAGLGSISGAAETYWGRNKGRSMEGMLVKITKILAVFFMLLALLILVLLIPYIKHYYLLENEVQKMYVQYDRIVQKMYEEEKNVRCQSY